MNVPIPPEIKPALTRAIEAIQKHHRFLIMGHAHPDGDCIGSTLAMMHLLKKLGKEVVAYNRDPVPYNLTFLPGADQMVTEVQDPKNFDLTCILDCHELSRVSPSFPESEIQHPILIIDHHRLKPHKADILLHRENAAATGELVYLLIQEMQVQCTPEMAQALYTALITDTGGFRYSSTSPLTLRQAANLLETGIDVWEISSHIYESNPLSRIQLLGQVLQTLRLNPEGTLASIVVNKAWLDRVGGDHALLDGFINHARSIRGVEVAVQLKEIKPKHYRVSFRSRGKIDVSEIAQHFGGGGHHNAAGCQMHGTPSEILEQLYQIIGTLLHESK